MLCIPRLARSILGCDVILGGSQSLWRQAGDMRKVCSLGSDKTVLENVTRNVW